eukprot:6736970-Prymnesium_polylepis.1
MGCDTPPKPPKPPNRALANPPKPPKPHNPPNPLNPPTALRRQTTQPASLGSEGARAAVGSVIASTYDCVRWREQLRRRHTRTRVGGGGCEVFTGLAWA